MSLIGTDIQTIVNEISEIDDLDFSFTDNSDAANCNSTDYEHSIYSVHSVHSSSNNSHCSMSSYNESNYSYKTQTSCSYESHNDSFPPPKAIFFNTSTDVFSTKQFHIQIFDETHNSSTIVKAFNFITSRQLISDLSKKKFMKQLPKFKEDDEEDLRNWHIGLRDESKDLELVLFDHDKPIKIQNEILRSMWIDEKDLNKAILSKLDSGFKFVLRKSNE